MKIKNLKRIIQEELKNLKSSKNYKRMLNEGKTCGCGVGEDGDDCLVLVSGGQHSGYWDCKCCCCVMDDAGSVRGPAGPRAYKPTGQTGQ